MITAGLNVMTMIVGSAAVAGYACLMLVAFWRPSLADSAATATASTVIALAYGALGVLVRDDLEGFSLIIIGSLMDTLLQNPLGNPLAGKPVLQWPIQFAVAGSLDHTALRNHLALDLAWAAGFAAIGLLVPGTSWFAACHHGAPRGWHSPNTQWPRSGPCQPASCFRADRAVSGASVRPALADGYSAPLPSSSDNRAFWPTRSSSPGTVRRRR